MIPTKSGFVAAALLSTAACVSPHYSETPLIEGKDYVHVEKLIRTARCELQASAKRPDRTFDFEDAGLTFKLQVIETRGPNGSVVLGLPVANGTLTLTGNRTQSGKATRKITFSITHDSKAAVDCSGDRIKGGLGIQGWLAGMDAIIRASDDTKARPENPLPSSISQTITFDVTLNEDLSPNFKRESSDISRSATSKSTNNRSVLNEIAVTIGPIAVRGTSGPKAARVEPSRRLQEAEIETFRILDDS